MRASILELDAGRALTRREAEQIRDVVVTGKILIYPTDTIYGIGCDAFNQHAVERICELKGRPPERPFSVHVGSVAELERFAEQLTPSQRAMLHKILPGPFTVVLNASSGDAPPWCVSREGKIGLRVPRSRSFQLVCVAARRPLVGTSVNRSGEPPLTRGAEIIQEFSERVDLIITTRERMTQESSSVIDMTCDPPRALRGSIPQELLEQRDG
jgi:L-threonylcarbamoyladenylate synthase